MGWGRPNERSSAQIGISSCNLIGTALAWPREHNYRSTLLSTTEPFVTWSYGLKPTLADRPGLLLEALRSLPRRIYEKRLKIGVGLFSLFVLVLFWASLLTYLN